jgi:hypothetical protein
MNDAATVYDEINAAWREADLIDRRVMDTPGWQAAVASVSKYSKERGWLGSPMGPVAGDTWFHWLHILSHCLEDGHGLTHAKCELQLAELVITALRRA